MFFQFQELTHDKQTLQEQVCEQLQQISSLRVQVDELKLYVYSSDEKQQSSVEIHELQQQLEAEKDAVESKENEVWSRILKLLPAQDDSASHVQLYG